MQSNPKKNYDKEHLIKTKKKNNFPKIATWLLLWIGALTLIASIIYDSSILAFIGLGLVFWGVLLLYIQPEQYTRKDLLDATLLPSLSTLNQIIQELDYNGTATYLPPKYFNNPEENKIFIPKQKNEKLPTPKQILEQENHLLIQKPHGILIAPPGEKLAKLFEKTLQTKFSNTDLQYIINNLTRLIVEDLEIAESLEIEKTNNEIKITIKNSTFTEAYKENKEFSQIYPLIGDPLSSAIACILTKATGNPITIKNLELSEDGQDIQTTYQILGNIETEAISQKIKIETQTKQLLTEPLQLLNTNRLFSNLIGLLAGVIGLFLFIQAAWITLYDATVWSKDISQILFGSRVGQSISLGIGMTLFHHFLLSLALVALGLVMLLRRNKNRVLAKQIIEPILSTLRTNLTSFLLISIGMVILFWIFWLTVFDATVWSKDISQILFGSRVGQFISLGIGMRLIYYLLISLAFLSSGIFMLYRKLGRM